MKICKCDYCGEPCESTPQYVLPSVEFVDTDIKGGSDNVVLSKYTSRIIQDKQVDICPKCREVIAEFTNLIKFCDVNIHAIEEDLFKNAQEWYDQLEDNKYCKKKEKWIREI
jgi:Zn-finger nucleic acid-binding protein